MRDFSVWSLGFGRWGSVHVRVHMLLFLAAVFVLYAGWLVSQFSPEDGTRFLGLACLGVLIFSVAWHELGHVAVVRLLGGRVEQIVLGPCGGLVPPRLPHDPRGELVAICAGPAANFLVCLASGIPLLLRGDASLVRLLHPLAPDLLWTSGGWVAAATLLFWINWVLVLVNLLPAFPFDGGAALRAALIAYWPGSGAQNTVVIVANLAKVSAAGLVVAAWLIDPVPGAVIPAWLPLLSLAVVVLFSARFEEHRAENSTSEDELFGYDFSQGYTSLERSTEARPVETRSGLLARWLRDRRESRRRRQQQLESEEDGRVDEILARLHKDGIQRLSDQDRQLLRRVAARYRSRQTGA